MKKTLTLFLAVVFVFSAAMAAAGGKQEAAGKKKSAAAGGKLKVVLYINGTLGDKIGRAHV